MNGPWFDPSLAWFPGTFLGVLGGIYGTTVGILAPRGKARRAVLAMHWTFLGLSVVLLLLGLTAWGTGQPRGVWYGLGLAGLIGTIVFGFNTQTVLTAYAMAEQRKMAARDVAL